MRIRFYCTPLGREGLVEESMGQPYILWLRVHLPGISDASFPPIASLSAPQVVDINVWHKFTGRALQ